MSMTTYIERPCPPSLVVAAWPVYMGSPMARMSPIELLAFQRFLKSDLESPLYFVLSDETEGSVLSPAVTVSDGSDGLVVGVDVQIWPSASTLIRQRLERFWSERIILNRWIEPPIGSVPLYNLVVRNQDEAKQIAGGGYATISN